MEVALKPQFVLPMLCAVALGGALLLEDRTALAFPFTTSWHMPADGIAGQNRAGAGGIYGVGSPSDFGILCIHCHVDPQAAIQVDIAVNPPFSTSGNDTFYSPSQQYDITVSIMNEVHTMDPMGNATLNGFAATFEAPDGAPMGVLIASAGRSDNCPAAPPTDTMGAHNRTVVYGDCHGVLYEQEPGDTSWSFQWIAPAAGAGELTMYYGVTDGNQNAENSIGDDSVQGTIVLLEQ